MADESYLISILLDANDRASSKIDALKRKIDGLKAQGGEQDMSRGLSDMADEAERAAEAHEELSRRQQESRRTAQQSESDIKRVAEWQEQAAEATTGHAESTEELRRQQQLLPRDAAAAESSVKRVTQHHDEATEAVAAHAASHDDLSESAGGSSKSLEDLVDKARDVEGAMDDAGKKTDELSAAQKRLREQTDEALKTFDDLSASVQDGSGDLRQLRQDLQASGQELGNLSRRFKTTSDDARLLRQSAEDAAAMASKLNALQSSSRQPIINTLGIDKAKQDLADLTQQYERFNAVARAAEEQEAARSTNRMFASRFGSVARGLPTDSADFTSAMQRQVEAKALATPPRSPRVVAPARDFSAEGDQLVSRMRSLDTAAQSRSASSAQLRVGYQQVASGLRSVSREMEVGSTDAKRFGDAMEEAGKKASNLDLARAAPGIDSMAQKFAAATDSIGVKVISLSAALRGMRLVGLVGLLQPLVTGLVSLAGGLFSVASGAGQAAATLGGVFISGLGQLVPMISVAIAGLIRLRDVFQAVSAAEQMRQQNFFEPNQGLITQLQNTSQLIEAEQNLSNAYYTLQDAQVQVKESQIALTQARIDAIRNLQDLVIAEKSAQLQLEGANLGVTQAQEQLTMAQSGGDQQSIEQARLGVQQAQLSQRQARLGVPRARQDLSLARGYGVSGSAEVLAASEGARQSRLGVVQAQQQIADAQRQVQTTKLTLAQPASQESQQAGTLQYLESLMSPTEKKLFSSLNGLEEQLQSPNSPLKQITDTFIQPFVAAGQRLAQLLDDPSFLAPIDRLAKSMSTAMDSIEHTMFGQRGTTFFETMASDASKSIPIVTSAITGLMKVFEDIARAAAPAFDKLSGDWSRFWNSMDARDRTPAGQAALTDFFNRAAKWADDFAHLATSVYDLVKALGSSAAPQGMGIVGTITQAAQGATDWVDNHKPEVTNFFQQAAQGFLTIGALLIQIGTTMIKVFSLSSLQAFADLLTHIVLPAARDFVDAIGFLVRGLTDLADIVPGLRQGLEGLVAVFFGIMAVNRVIHAVNAIRDAFLGIRIAISGAKAMWDAFRSGGISGLKDAFSSKSTGVSESITSAGETAGETMATAIKTAGSDVAAEWRAALTEGGAKTAAEIEAAEVTGAAAVTAEEETGGIAPGILAAGGLTSASRVAGRELPAEESDALEVLGLGGGAGVLAKLGGTLSSLGSAAQYGGIGAALYGLFRGFTNIPNQGTTGSGLAGLLGPLGSSHYSQNLGAQLSQLDPFSSNFSPVHGFLEGNTPQTLNENNATSSALLSLQKGLQGISDPAQLSTSQLQKLYRQAEQIAQMPDITAQQRSGLQELIGVLNPSVVAISKAQQAWGQTLQMFQTTTPNVMQQLTSTVGSNFATIKSNFTSGTSTYKNQIVGLYQAGMSEIDQLGSEGVKGAGQAIDKLQQMLNKAVGKLGGKDVQIATKISTGASNIVGDLPIFGGAQAQGGWNSARPGGRLIQVAEGGHDEVTLTTDPRHAVRQQALLGQYLQRAPHMAEGGFVAEPGTNFSYGEEPEIVAALTKLADAMHLTVYGISGYRSPAQSVAVGGFSNDPHTRGQAADIGVNSLLRSSAALLSNSELARYGLWRPFDMYGQDPTELNHVQLLPSVGGPAEGVTPPKAGSGAHGLATAAIANGVVNTARGLASSVQSLIAPKVSGIQGAFGQIAQGVVNKVTTAANSFLSAHGAGLAGASGAAGAALHGAANVISKATLQSINHVYPKHLTGTPGAQFSPSLVAAIAQWAGMPGWTMSRIASHESNYEPGIVQAGQPYGTTGWGLWQITPGDSVPSVGVDDQLLNPLLNARAAAVKYGGGGLQPWAVDVEDGIAGSVQNYTGKSLAVGGLLGKHARRMAVRHLRKKVMRFAAGGRAPWGGEPVPIVAHEGERVVNPPQWNELARLSGTTAGGLDHHLGYDTGAPRQSFDVGGPVVTGATPQLQTTSILTGRGLSSFVGTQATSLTGIAKNLSAIDPGSIATGLTAIQKVFQSVLLGFQAVGKLGGKTTSGSLSAMSTLVSALTNQTDGLLLQLSAEFQRYQNNLADWVTKTGYSLSSVAPSKIGTLRKGKPGEPKSTILGGVSLTGPALTAKNVGHTGDASLDLLNQKALGDEASYTSKELDATQAALNAVSSNIKSTKNSKLPTAERDKALAKLEQQYNALLQGPNGLETLQQQMNQNITNRFQNEQQYIQDTQNQIDDVYQTQQQNLQTKQSTAESKGNYSALPSIDKAVATSSQKQITALQPVLKEAEKTGDSDLVAQIKQQISQLKQQVGQSIAQMVQDKFSGVEQTFQTSSAQLEGQQSSAEAMGNYNILPGIDATIVASTNQHIAALKQVLAQANATGNQGLAAQIQQEIAQLQSTVDQETAQMIQDQLSQIQQVFQTQQAQIQGQQSTAEAMGNYAALPSIDQSLADSANAQIAQLQALLAQTPSTDPGAIAQIEQEIASLQGTVAQATAQMIQDSISAVQQSAQTTGAQVSMMQSISQTMEGAATTPGGFAAAGALNLQALNLNQTSIESQLGAYQGLLGQAQTAGDTGAVASITQEIDQLTAELATNTQAIDDNTATVVNQTAQYIQSRGQFQTGVYGGLSQVIQTIGQTTGYTDVGALQGLTTASNTSLTNTQGGLLSQLSQLGGGASSLATLLSGASSPAAFASALGGANIGGIESGQDASWISTFEGIVNSLTQNTEAIAENNQQLATLNGQLLQPQQWSTSAWSSFRAAIFGGMGSLLPQYQGALPAGAAPTIAPMFGSSTLTTNSPSVGTLNINHAPTSSLDPAIIGEQLAHEVSGALG